jgi:hypothetical protein
MPASDLRLIKRWVEFCDKSELNNVPHNTRGIYALLKKCRREKYDVVYIGMAGRAGASIRGRLRTHRRNKLEWTHFSAFEVWDNITEQEIRELEGLFRQIYRKDTRANKINRQRSFKLLRKVHHKLPWETREQAE